MSPLEAVLSGPADELNAEFFGWLRPYADVAHLAEARSEIEAHTDRLHAADFEILTDTERGELRQLTKAALAHAPQ